ncbi:hypothetical protein BJX76DRAFT_352128 [Aspergillus varians]
MARPEREEERISSPPNPALSKRKGKNKSKSPTRTKHRSATDAEGKDNIKRPKCTAGATLDEDGDKDEEYSSDPKTTPDDDFYSLLLTFICRHDFMRNKRYPVPRSLRVRFVREVQEEGAVLGYEKVVVDRVLLDIKRYYLECVGHGAAFDEGAGFGDEVDDSSFSGALKGSRHKKRPKGKGATPTLDDELESNDPDVKAKLPKFQEKKKRKRSSEAPIPVEVVQGKNRKSPSSEKGETQKKSQSRLTKRKQRSGKARSSRATPKTNDSWKNANDLPGLTTGDEVRSKYFMNLRTTDPISRIAVNIEASRDIPNRQSFPEKVLGLLDDMGLASDLLLSDSTLSDVPSDFDSVPDSPPSPAPSLSRKSGATDEALDRAAETSSELVKLPHRDVPRGAREQTPPQLDLLINPTLLQGKKPRLKPTKISPYFQGPLVNENSCLPFPPIDAPDFGLVQEQLAHDPFRLLLGTIFLNRTRGGVALPILFQVFDTYPTTEAMAAANASDLTAMINRLGFQNQRARKCIALAQTWLDRPPCRGKRYRKLNYPRKSDGRDVKPDECIDDNDQRVAWEIAHLPGVGAYALDSWRIFCRDKLRDLSKGWQGGDAVTAGFTPEWKSVLPQDKELRAYLTWMWLKEGWVWDRETGERTRASEKVMRAARRGAMAHIESGNWVLETSPVKPNPPFTSTIHIYEVTSKHHFLGRRFLSPSIPPTNLHSSTSLIMFLPLRLNDRDRNRDRNRKLSSSSSTSLKSKHRQNRSTSQKQPSRPLTKDPEDPEPPVRSSTPSTSAPNPGKQRRSSMPGLDSASRSGTASFLESRTSLPYPTFSKAHSKEAVGKPGVPTPDPTDLTEQNQDDDDKNDSRQRRPDSRNAPPSPPLTSVDQHSRKGSTVEDKGEKTTEKVKDGKTKIRIKTDLNRSSSSLRAKKDDSSKASKTTVRPDTTKSKHSSHGKDSPPSRSASHKPSKSKLDPERKRTSAVSPPPRSPSVRDIGLESANGSDATIAAPRHSPSRVKSPEKPPSRNQTRSSMSNRPISVNRNRTPLEIAMEYGRSSTVGSTYGTPPPPPPPPDVPIASPRVDYLLHNGGLDHQAPKSLLLNTVFGDQPQVQPHLAASRVFEPFSRLLDDYQCVLNKNGSLAVATGSRSVARRLLDRLEAVFARDISSESCCCLMCEHDEFEELPSGVSWGEVLELVSGRRELPNWPPFILTTELGTADISGDEHIPMQKMDIDVPEEYRDHFLRQSRKTKLAVDRWLTEQVEQPTSAPEEVDDETLTFAMLTHLGTDQRPIFRALLGMSPTAPTPRPDGEPRERPPALVSSAYAIQRLYRLSSRPRDPEAAMYMLNNPGMHHVLATLAAISDDEWDILISGRFDGFLRSGAEDSFPNNGSTPNRWSNSRSTTPFSAGRMSRGPTPNPLDRPMSQPYGGPGSPGSFGGPIALDEETEIAALAEVEREIYAGMEALEDAFEALHCKAEAVRIALRERGAGLSIANQNRRGTFVEARLGTPASGYPWESGMDDDFLDDTQSLAPDDSASNISSNRRRRPKRRTERRTPAPVEEEDEGEDGSHSGRRDSRNSRRR